MTTWLFLLGCFLLVTLVVVSTFYGVYSERMDVCRADPDPRCYSDWSCNTSSATVENVYTTRFLPYLQRCGTASTDPTTTCPCITPADNNGDYTTPYTDGVYSGATNLSSTNGNLCV